MLEMVVLTKKQVKKRKSMHAISANKEIFVHIQVINSIWYLLGTYDEFLIEAYKHKFLNWKKWILVIKF